MPLRDTVEPVRAVTGGVVERQIDFMRYTRPQRLWMSEVAQLALWLDGNQLGKTTGFHADFVHRARGTHPFQRVHAPPVNIVLLGASWPQMRQPGGFMEKLWELLPKDEIDPNLRFTRGYGFSGTPPRILFTSGPGKGSVISFSTFDAGPDRVQGGTLHAIGSDEPLPMHVYEELVPRVMRHGGVVRMNFTPRTGMPNMDSMRELVTNGVVKLHQYGLLEENCWPEGAPAPYLSAARIEAMVSGLPAHVRRMRQFGDWEPVRTDQSLYNYAADVHVRADAPPHGAWLCVCVDHGTGTQRQHASLIAMSDVDTTRPRLWVWDQAVVEKKTTGRQDAEAIREMLDRNRVPWEAVDCWVGDRAVVSSEGLVQKSNELLRRHLAAAFGVSPRRMPRFEKPRKWVGSVEHWIDVWNSILADFDADNTPHCIIHPRCARVQRFAATHTGDPKDPLKDAGDTVRYGIEKGLAETVFAPFRHMRG